MRLINLPDKNASIRFISFVYVLTEQKKESTKIYYNNHTTSLNRPCHWIEEKINFPYYPFWNV